MTTKIISKNGLTNKEWTQVEALLIKANDEQLNTIQQCVQHQKALRFSKKGGN